MKRRVFLQWGGVSASAGLLPSSFVSADEAIDIIAKQGKTNIVGPQFPATDVWGFNGQVPGLPIRIQHGQELKVRVRNELEVPTAVHWHGIRLPNAMDGVAGLTQAAIKPGDSFDYQFVPPDAGTFWYHSHVNAYEQVGRGLYGPLIIEELRPPVVDRDLVWMIDDWRLRDDASISDDFGSGHDRSHAGRIGNVPTVNGRYRDVITVRTGERIRLRLINASNARNFSLSFGDLKPSVVAIDGMAVKTYQPTEPVVVGAASRVDLIIDMSADPGARVEVVDNFYREAFKLAEFVFDEKPIRESALNSTIDLDPPQLPEPDLENAKLHEVTIAGGAMGGLRRAQFKGEWMGLREIAQQGYVWALNEVVGHTLKMPPLIDTQKGTSIRLVLHNETAFPHPMHLHGHHMKLLSIDGRALPDPYWVDSPLVLPNQSMELAFVADNPGDWLLHCHALEHHAAGLGALVRIA